MKSYEHRLVDVVNNPPSGETYDAIGREADARITELEASAAVMRMTVMQLYDLLAEQGSATEQYDFKVRKEAAVRRAMSALQSTQADTALLERMAVLEAVCDSWVHGGTGQELDWGWADHKALAAYRAHKESNANPK
jgi:uncharacterized coiled-coil protein SlyX